MRARAASLFVGWVLLVLWESPVHAWVCTVTVSGPSEAVVGETITLTATATVPGGSFDWSLTHGLSPLGASGTFTYTGSSPETVTISVNYLNPKGPPCSASHTIAIIAPTLTIVQPQATWMFITETETRVANLTASATISPDRIHTQFASGISWELPADPTSGPSTTLTGQGETWTPQIDVPPHGKDGRPGPLSYTFMAKVTIFGNTWDATPVTVTERSPDPVRQQYVDHAIKVPAREDFVGDRIPLKPELPAGEAATQTAYADWVRQTRQRDTAYRLANNRSSTYRTPQYNESLKKDRGSKDHSLHQYGWAVDWSPILDEGGGPGKRDDCVEIARRAKLYGGATYSYCAPKLTHVHGQWRDYIRVSDFHFPNILEQ
ncbi:MAG: hypothetical protein C3F12_09455 [Candidatus Methylomirabilota bacterium]|nr:hypothetical protein [candidate division NC10 bacterium]PWB46259.1 MAG: hypothetical protein C3F12_09455 [candidate division NC10 bacterium]